MFRAATQGFQITFDNGYTVSVMFGDGNYCLNRCLKPDNADNEMGSCKDAEVLIFGADDIAHSPVGVSADGAIGWQTPEQVGEWIAYAKNLQRK